MSQEDDLRLLRDCRDGRPGAWEAFVERFAPYLAEICQRTLQRCARPSGPQEVDDMLQEVFLNFLENDRRALKRYLGKSGVAAYLASIAVHRVLNDKTWRRGSSSLPPFPVAQAAGPLEALESRELLDLLRRETEGLPRRARLAFALQARGASLKEVGRALGISEDAAGQLLSRARGLLGKRLGGDREK